ncbi:MAG: hypothetical protein LKF53_04260 [Solobacterium sp.]|jgi:hypothetical protein|nr:hypothetical protein [Solobacterium sp.]MCH4205587.1 hypothetical protein [Solobacterium sp.]MCH4227078.1 hypothetical protein [Solobacterium sp.]MCH4282350.1 hypothetical protein [Solobacterium sp.]
MKKTMTVILAAAFLCLFTAAFSVRESIVHNGVQITAESVVTNGSIIKMQIAAVRSNQTITSVTYELADDTQVNVHVSMDFAERHAVSKEQTLQLLLPNEKTVHFYVNEQMLSTSLQKDGAIWKTVG